MNGAPAGLTGQIRALITRALQAYQGTGYEQRVRTAAARLEEPLRVAIAGKVKAGKSTLLNALIGEELAPTDAGECTKIVTWYRDGPTYAVKLQPIEGEPVQAPFSRDGGHIEVDLGGRKHEEVHRLIVEWPSASLRSMTLIDTPGIGSVFTEISGRTHEFLAPGDDRATEADAVLYLMRHLHSTDVRFLESFHDEDVAQATPVNAIGVLSRADEIGVGRLDAMASANRIAERYRHDSKIRRLCQTVVPVAGLIAETGETLREVEFVAMSRVAAAPREETDALLLTADRFVRPETSIDLTPIERQALLERFGLFGIRLSVALIRQKAATTAPQLSRELVRRSGLDQLREVLTTQFASRTEVLKARSALLELEALFHESPVPGADALSAELERIGSGAHAFAEIRLLNAIRTGAVAFPPEEVEEAERLLGAAGEREHMRLGLQPRVTVLELRVEAAKAMAKWQARAESPMSSREVVDGSRVLVRTCEGLLAGLKREPEPPPPPPPPPPPQQP